MITADFTGVFQYFDLNECEEDKTLVLAIAGYDTPQQAAHELQISEHKAQFLWKYLKQRSALYGMKNYEALKAWASTDESILEKRGKTA